MAGSSMTFALNPVIDGQGRDSGIQRLVCTFTSDSATGAATATTSYAVCGEVFKVVSDPGATAPDANWDIVVTDENGLNPFAKCQNVARLLARHTTNTEEDYLYLLNGDATPIGIAAFPYVCGPLTIAVANCGNSKIGVFTFYIKT